MHAIDKRLRQLDIELPQPTRPAGAYLPVICQDGLLFVSGQFPMLDGELRYRGQVGRQQDVANACLAAELAALNVLAHIRQATHHWQRFASLLRLEGHIASTADWHQQPEVLDSASQLFDQVLGEQGRHTRTAFAPSHLPLDATVELVVIARVYDSHSPSV